MALPKHKISKARRDRRRAQQKIKGVEITICPQCNEHRLPHHMCPKCGYYKGRLVMEIAES